MKGKKTIFHKRKQWIVFGLAAGILMVSTGIYFVQGKSAKKASAEEIPVQETQAKTGTISNSIVGTGNLEHQEGKTVTIPTGIIVEEVKVESGDQVSEGDVLATVNQTSVLRAMEEIQEQMETLDEEINESKETADTQSVKSKVDGRVKKIYVQQGQEAAECMVEQGALLLLSIDGFLAVEFETNAELIKEDAVIVNRADGTQKEGTVETFSDGKCTVLFSDSGIGMEEDVTITDSEGNDLGKGTTYIHQPLAVTAASGMVEEICVSEDEAVYTGTILFTIDQVGESLEYKEQMAERQELAQDLQKLMILSQNGAITAESSGMIQSVNISAKSSQNSQENTENVQISKQQNTKGSMEAVQVSSQNNQSAQGNTAIIQISNQNMQNNTRILQLSNQTSDVDINPQMPSGESDEVVDPQMPSEEQTYLSLEITDSGQCSQNLLVIKTPQTGAKPQAELTAADNSYEGTITWKPEDKKFAATTSYQAEVELNAAEGYYFTKESVSKIKTGVLSGMTVLEEGTKLTFQITYPLTDARENDDHSNNNEENESNHGNNDGNGNQNNNGNNGENGNQNNTGNNDGNGNNNGNEKENENTNENQEGTGNNNTNGSQESNISGAESVGGNHAQNSDETSQDENGAGNGQTQTASGNGSGGGIMTSSTSVSTSVQSDSKETSSDTDDSEITAFTLAAADTMILSVNVDELDINSVSKEQQAEIVLDAIEDEVFTGTVTKVGNSASSSSGGVAKYTVEISIPRDERMKEGMNASATITVEERENVVTIPVNALQERGSRVFVYTETDSDGSLSGEKEVTTGLSDGSNVEITEGLSDGDIVYYQKIGNISQKNGEQNFHKMEGEPGADMENMRQGDFPSGGAGSGMPSGRMPNGRE